MDSCSFPSTTLIGRLLRLPLRALSPNAMVRVLCGPARGMKWVAHSGNHGFWMGLHEPKKRQQLMSVLNIASVFYDIGANVGYYTLPAACLARLVIAFEPNPRNTAYLYKHLHLNNVSNVQVIEAAIGDCDGEALFNSDPGPGMGHIDKIGAKVSLVRIDTLVSSGTIPPPDAIEMDIEGGELAALVGGRETLERYRPILFLSTHGHEIRERCHEFLSSLGYEIEGTESHEAICRPRPST